MIFSSEFAREDLRKRFDLDICGEEKYKLNCDFAKKLEKFYCFHDFRLYSHLQLGLDKNLLNYGWEFFLFFYFEAATRCHYVEFIFD